MKNRNSAVLLLTAILLVVVSGLFAEELIVENTHSLIGNSDNPFFFPSYTVDGKSILITRTAYTGLWVLDRETSSVVQVSEARGAGYQPVSLPSGSIVFREDEYRLGRKHTSLIQSFTGSAHALTEPKRFLSAVNIVDDRLVYMAGSSLEVINASSETREAPAPELTALFNDKLTLKVLHNGEFRPIAPQGKGKYIWGTLSPQNDKIAYTKAGQGTYICDLDGKVLADIGFANVPQWSPDGDYIVFMRDLDDGDRFTASEIWVSTADGSQSWMITDTPGSIEMYPQWSPDGKHIVYHTLSGEIFETTIRITD